MDDNRKQVWKIFEFAERLELADDSRKCRKSGLMFIQFPVGSGDNAAHLEDLEYEENYLELMGAYICLARQASKRSRAYRGYLLIGQYRPAQLRHIARWLQTEPERAAGLLNTLKRVGLLEQVAVPAEWDLGINDGPSEHDGPAGCPDPDNGDRSPGTDEPGTATSTSGSGGTSGDLNFLGHEARAEISGKVRRLNKSTESTNRKETEGNRIGAIGADETETQPNAEQPKAAEPAGSGQTPASAPAEMPIGPGQGGNDGRVIQPETSGGADPPMSPTKADGRGAGGRQIPTGPAPSGRDGPQRSKLEDYSPEARTVASRILLAYDWHPAADWDEKKRLAVYARQKANFAAWWDKVVCVELRPDQREWARTEALNKAIDIGRLNDKGPGYLRTCLNNLVKDIKKRRAAAPAQTPRGLR